MTLLEHEPLIRLAAFIGVFAAVAAWEICAPRRRLAFGKATRWTNNLGLLLVDVITSRLLAPGAAVAIAVAGEAGHWGLLNMIALPAWAAILVSVVLLDLVVYFQHVMFHAVPTLWRLHRVHHADLDFDVTTGIRFHPVEILISTALKCAAVAAVGAPAAGVVAFELLLNATALFNHANASMPRPVDAWLRWLVVTPDMHRVHHSVQHDESSSNFGFNLPWWDRVFGTYRAHPRLDHVHMAIGVDAFREADELRLDRMLLQPLRDTPGQYPINRRPGAA
jgi:sterol desaturase/sphingolipid hydroxylase (fatty acid hydroxylase superfamily)